MRTVTTFLAVLLISVVCLGQDGAGGTSSDDPQKQISDLKSQLAAYKTALDNANSEIDRLNHELKLARTAASPSPSAGELSGNKWTIVVVSHDKVIAPLLQSQIDQIKQEKEATINQLQQRWSDPDQRLSYLLSRAHRTPQEANEESDLNTLITQRNDYQTQIDGIQNRINTATACRLLTATLPNGSRIRIYANTASGCFVADSLAIGSAYEITGSIASVGGVPQITLASAISKNNMATPNQNP